jgi:hypothetical protein
VKLLSGVMGRLLGRLTAMIGAQLNKLTVSMSRQGTGIFEWEVEESMQAQEQGAIG